jgi:predicted ATPase
MSDYFIISRKELHVKKSNIIASAVFDLSKKLSIFVGENGAGKSYLANIIFDADSKKAKLYAGNFNSIKDNISEYYSLAELIETEILNGKIVIGDDGAVKFQSNKKSSPLVDFSISSSLVKSLCPLIIYLKYAAKLDDLVLAEEPESGLHPSAQIMLVRIFAMLINSGLRLLISTHNDYIIREINNLIKISANQDTKEIAEKLGYTDNQYINKDDIAAYEFRFKNKSSTTVHVKSIKIDEFGFDTPTFDDTTDKLNNCHMELFSVLAYGK